MNLIDSSRPQAVEIKPPGSLRLAAWLIPAALVAGVISWIVGEGPGMKVPAALVPMVTMGTQHMGVSPQTEQAAQRASATRQNGAFGALLGFLLALAGSLALGSGARAWRAAAVGLVLAGAAGASVSWGMVPLYFRFGEAFSDDIIASILLHGSIWGAIGLATGASVAMGLGGGVQRLLRLLIGGLVGAVIGTAVYELLGAVFLPNDDAGGVIPNSSAARLIARLLVSLITAIGLAMAMAVRDRRIRKAATDSSNAPASAA